MDSNRIKRLATGAREELRREVSGRLDAVLAADSPERLEDRAAVEALVARVAAEGRERVVDSAAYTWFNRLCALRYMDARGHTPTPAVTPRKGSTLPAVLADAQAGLFDPGYAFAPEVRARVAALLTGQAGAANATEAAYAELLRAVCDHYADAMPFLFSEDAASWLLMPRSLLAEGSILHRVIDEMDDVSCESVEVLGWLYQYYIEEQKKEITAALNKGKKAAPEEIAPVTQLFTPKWIVRYLCENSLGRLWMLNNSGSTLADGMDYFIAPEVGEPHCEIASASDIRVLDPACGSGHILVYAFELLFAMYEEEGWLPEDIPAMVLRDNLFGLEVDFRAAEIAMFALTAKALERDPRFLEHAVTPRVCVLEGVVFDDAEHTLLTDALRGRQRLLEAMAHMPEVGSLYVPEAGDIEAVHEEIERIRTTADFNDMIAARVIEKLETVERNLDGLSGSYHCVIANPPYMGLKRFGEWLYANLSAEYPSSYFDMYCCFIERSFTFAKRNGYSSFVVMHTWATDKSYMGFRRDVLGNHGVVSMMHMDVSVMPIAFETSATVFSNMVRPQQDSVFQRVDASFLEDGALDPGTFRNLRVFLREPNAFNDIPESIIAYWMPGSAQAAFRAGRKLGDVVAPRVGIQTGDTERFLRDWWEVPDARRYVPRGSSSGDPLRAKWVPYKNAGDFRKWYGNNITVINWENDGHEVIGLASAEHRKVMSLPVEYRFKRLVSWNDYGLGATSMRYCPEGYLFDVIEPAFVDVGGDSASKLMLIQAFVNSSVASMFIRLLMPGRHKNVGKMAQLPFDFELAEGSAASALSEQNASLSKADWDSFEVSWDFKRHPLV